MSIDYDIWAKAKGGHIKHAWKSTIRGATKHFECLCNPDLEYKYPTNTDDRKCKDCLKIIEEDSHE